MEDSQQERPMHRIPGAFQRLTELYAEGERLVEEGRFEEAVRRFSEGIAIDDHFRQRYVTLYAQRAFALQKLGRTEEAIGDYGRAIEMEPPIHRAQYHFHRGMCFAAREGGAEDAIADYTAAIAIHPDHPGPWHLRGKLYADKLEKYEEAIADFDKLLSMIESADGLMWRGLCKFELGRYEEARADFAASQAIAPNPFNVTMIEQIDAASRPRG